MEDSGEAVFGFRAVERPSLHLNDYHFKEYFKLWLFLRCLSSMFSSFTVIYPSVDFSMFILLAFFFFFLIKFIWGLICIVWNSLFLDTVLGIHTFWRHGFVSFDKYIQILAINIIMIEDIQHPQIPPSLFFSLYLKPQTLNCSLQLQFPSLDGHRDRSTVWSFWSLGFFT